MGNVCRSRVSQADSYSAEDRVTQAAPIGTRWVSGSLTNTKPVRAEQINVERKHQHSIHLQLKRAEQGQANTQEARAAITYQIPEPREARGTL